MCLMLCNARNIACISTNKKHIAKTDAVGGPETGLPLGVALWPAMTACQ